MSKVFATFVLYFCLLLSTQVFADKQRQTFSDLNDCYRDSIHFVGIWNGNDGYDPEFKPVKEELLLEKRYLPVPLVLKEFTPKEPSNQNDFCLFTSFIFKNDQIHISQDLHIYLDLSSRSCTRNPFWNNEINSKRGKGEGKPFTVDELTRSVVTKPEEIEAIVNGVKSSIERRWKNTAELIVKYLELKTTKGSRYQGYQAHFGKEGYLKENEVALVRKGACSCLKYGLATEVITKTKEDLIGKENIKMKDSEGVIRPIKSEDLICEFLGS